MQRPTRRMALAAATAAALLLAGCSSSQEPEEATEDAATEPTTAEESEATATDAGDDEELAMPAESFPEPTAEDFNRLLAPTDELDLPAPLTVRDVTSPEPDVLVLAFEMGSHHCYGVRSAVTETASEVVISLEWGRKPDVDPTACVLGVYPYTTEVALENELGDRVVVVAEPTEPDDGRGEAGAETSPDAEEEAIGVQVIDTPEAADVALEPYIGRPIEDAVEWAIDNGVEWRILSWDGEPVEDSSPVDPERASFIVVADRVVAWEWS